MTEEQYEQKLFEKDKEIDRLRAGNTALIHQITSGALFDFAAFLIGGDGQSPMVRALAEFLNSRGIDPRNEPLVDDWHAYLKAEGGENENDDSDRVALQPSVERGPEEDHRQYAEGELPGSPPAPQSEEEGKDR
jgi:hypothetical protein